MYRHLRAESGHVTFSLGHIFEKVADICESGKAKQLLTGKTSELCHRILPTCHKYVAEANRMSNYMTNALTK